MREPPRPRRKLRLLWILAGIVLLFGAWFVWQLFGPNPAIMVSKETTFVTEPLGTDGLPDYEAHWLAENSAGVTPENNAAVLLWQAMWPGELEQEHWLPMAEALGMEQVPSEQGSLVSPYDETVLQAIAQELAKRYTENAGAEDGRDYFNTAWQGEFVRGVSHELVSEAKRRSWTSEQIPALAKWVEENQRPLDILVRASKRQRYYSPSPTMLNGSKDMLISMLLPDIQMMRNAMRALNVRAMWHLGEGRTAEAWQDILACHRIARLTSENDTLVGQLVAMAIASFACDATTVLLQSENISSDQAHSILKELKGLGPASFCARALDQGERVWCLDSVLYLARGNRDSLDMLGIPSESFQLLNSARVDWDQILRKMNVWYDKFDAAIELPRRSDRDAAFQKIDDELDRTMSRTKTPVALLSGLFNCTHRSEVVGNFILGMMLPASQAVFNAEDRNRAQLEMTIVTAALAVYRIEHGEYPEQLDELVPSVLPKLPIDLYSNKPFLYERRGNGYLLYSVFENGADDGGTDQSGEIIAGEWLEEQSGDNDYSNSDPSNSDLVIRVPMPELKFPTAPDDNQY